MKTRLDLVCPSPDAWIEAVMNDFDSFLIDHADCERKASAMMMGLIAKYPNRTEIVPQLIETAIEELEHFRDVYKLLETRGLRMPDKMDRDPYVQELVSKCRHTPNERFMDRVLLGSVVENRGAERFKLVYHALEKGELKDFYHRLWASEAKHGELFVHLTMQYFSEEEVYKRLEELNEMEGEIISKLPIRAALH